MTSLHDEAIFKISRLKMSGQGEQSEWWLARFTLHHIPARHPV